MRRATGDIVCRMSVPWLDIIRDAIKNAVLALATVDSNGHPRVRSVICRRIDDDGSLLITTDARSDKHAQLRSHAEAAAVIWLEETREQVRFVGRVEILGADSSSQERIELWQEMPPQSRAMFFWPTPGLPRESDDAAFLSSSEAMLPPVVFEVLKLRPKQVEYLGLTAHPHLRLRWTMGERWECEELNP